MSAASNPALPLDRLLIRDADRLGKQIGRAHASGKPLDAARFAKDLQAAEGRAAQRRALVPTQISYPDELPVVQAKDEILRTIAANPVVILCGETGSGKTTQLPKLCLELGRGTRGLIGHTQPRRLAARSVANRIASELKTNLGDLLAQLKRPQEFEALEQEFNDRILGDYRRDIFSAYSKYRTAETIHANLKALSSGTVSQRTVLEQASVRDSAAATFRAACEQATFDAKQKVGKADATFDDASHRLDVARQRLTYLTGQAADQIGDLSKVEALSTWPVTAPFAASVEELFLAASERVRQGEDILLLADTTKLWVQADIRDKDWSALTLSKGQKIQVQSPALPKQTLDATIAFIGRTVNAETRATPLVADIQNDDRLLKPGMFVRVLLPDGSPVQALAVPDAAVVRHEGRVFVFVETGPREFTPRDVRLGLGVDPWVEIKSGLAVGDRIAISGTFILKSELLLEPEE